MILLHHVCRNYKPPTSISIIDTHTKTCIPYIFVWNVNTHRVRSYPKKHDKHDVHTSSKDSQQKKTRDIPNIQWRKPYNVQYSAWTPKTP